MLDDYFLNCFRLTCGHILHWNFRPDPAPLANVAPIFVAFMGCGTTSKAAGVLACPCGPPPPGEELFDEPDRKAPVAP